MLTLNLRHTGKKKGKFLFFILSRFCRAWLLQRLKKVLIEATDKICSKNFSKGIKNANLTLTSQLAKLQNSLLKNLNLQKLKKNWQLFPFEISL
jgi:hypothetical protein